MTNARFHVHMHVADLDANVRFYTRLFGAEPSVLKPDYAKWMLEDPRLNFAISLAAEHGPGIAHLGLQAESPEALQEIGARLRQTDAVQLAEHGTTCCYARSDKLWTQDPQGVIWEGFHTHGESATYYASDVGHPAAACADSPLRTPASVAETRACGTGGGVAA